MSRFADLVLKHRRLVGLFWLVVLLAGAASSGAISRRLSTGEDTYPGQPAYEANQAILRDYGTGGDHAPLVPVISLQAGATADAARARLGAAFAAAGRAVDGRVVSYASTADRRFVSADGRTTFGLVFTDQSDLSEQVGAAMRGRLPTGAVLRITGIGPLSNAHDDSSGTGVLELTLFGGLGALAVLAFVFGSLLALVPLLVAAVAILATFLAVGALSTITTVNLAVEYIAALVGLGVAIDYSLLLVTRWREETQRGHAGDDAVRRAMSSAGRTVALSSVIVAAGLLSIVVLPVPSLRSLGYGGMLVPLMAAAVTLTLLPVILSTVGSRLDWPHRRREDSASRGWTAWTRGVIRARWLAIALAAGALAALAAFALGLHTGTPRADSLTTSGPAHDGLVALRQAGLGPGVLTPLEVLVPAGTDPATVATRLDRVPGVFDAIAPTGGQWRQGGTALVSVLPAAETSTGAGRATIGRVRDVVARDLPGVQVGGTGPLDIDAARAVYGAFPWMLALISVVTLLLVARAFRSVVLAVKAVVLDLLSIAAVIGAVVLVWQDGHGSRLIAGIPAGGAVNLFIPIIVFAFLFGLSMDYEVFLLSRIREEYDRTGSTRAAVVEGLGRTGRLVTSAALILFLAFATLAAAPGTVVKVFGTALGAGILLDATVVRSLLVPALITVFGRWNWWLPHWAARVLLLRARPAPPVASELPDRVPS